MNYFRLIACGISFSLLTLFSLPAFAVVIEWTDWQSSVDNYSASGEINVDGTTVGVNYSGTGSHSFVQTGTGTNFWSGSAYTNGVVENAPTAAELVALNGGGTVTISFSETIKDPFLALNSWNGNTVDFGEPITFDSFGAGYWGNGVPTINSTGFYGVGEVHGIISLTGDYDSISFTHTNENWHGFTVGVVGLASPIPEPGMIWLFTLGSAFMLLIARRRAIQKTVVL